MANNVWALSFYNTGYGKELMGIFKTESAALKQADARSQFEPWNREYYEVEEMEVQDD